jgi:hypothetical protein
MVWKIERLTGIGFGDLKAADPLGAVGPEEGWSLQARLLEHPSEIVL